MTARRHFLANRKESTSTIFRFVLARFPAATAAHSRVVISQIHRANLPQPCGFSMPPSSV